MRNRSDGTTNTKGLDYYYPRCKCAVDYKHRPDNETCIKNQVKWGRLVRG